jgi:nucleolar protein 4
MTSLGKRKHAEEAEDAESAGPSASHGSHQEHSSTLFVSNLPYTFTSTDLKTLFSDFAPVRSAFVVTEKSAFSGDGAGVVSKGVGYVSFALREDANGVWERFNGEAKGEDVVVGGRKLRVSWADKKSHSTSDDTKTKSKSTNKKPKIHPTSNAGAGGEKKFDPTTLRTVLVSNLPTGGGAGITSKVLWKKFRKVQGVESVVWPLPIGMYAYFNVIYYVYFLERTDGNPEGDPTKAHLIFSSPSLAHSSINKIHAHVFKGSIMEAVPLHLRNKAFTGTSSFYHIVFTNYIVRV